MTKDTAKLAYALMDKYSSMFAFKYDRKPSLNKYKEKWAMVDVIDSVGYDRALEILEYYFKTVRPGHPLTWFYMNFDKLDDIMVKLDDDKARRAKLREQTKRLVEENE